MTAFSRPAVRPSNTALSARTTQSASALAGAGPTETCPWSNVTSQRRVRLPSSTSKRTLPTALRRCGAAAAAFLLETYSKTACSALALLP